MKNRQWQYFNKNGYDKIPVFFKDIKDKVEHFGFSRLYKMSNTRKLHELGACRRTHFFDVIKHYKNLFRIDFHALMCYKFFYVNKIWTSPTSC